MDKIGQIFQRYFSNEIYCYEFISYTYNIMIEDIIWYDTYSTIEDAFF